MGELVQLKIFSKTDNHLREKEDFAYTLFENLNFKEEDKPISFFRSDFRGAKFVNVIFYFNNLDRADFISCAFLNCQFINTNFASSEIKNCYFDNVKFVNNKYNNTSIQECTFHRCEFEDENLLINMKNCSFIESKLSNCKFERSTTEKIVWEKCVISTVDYANMFAERYSFKSCTLTDVNIDICYIFGYLFYDTNIYGISIIYMGDEVEFTKDNMLTKFASNLLIQQRYYEFINANIIFDNLNNVPDLVKKAFNELSKNSGYSRRLETINIFDLLQFYSTCNKFDFIIIKDIMYFLEDFNWNQFDFDEKILYLAQLHKFKLYITEFAYDNKFIGSANTDVSFVTFHCNVDDYNLALSTIKQCLNEICHACGLASTYDVINAQKGSWIITIAVITSCALMLPKIFKKYADVILEINTKSKISRKIADNLNKKNLNMNDLRQISNIAATSASIHHTAENLDLSDLSKIVDMLKIEI
jgi:uncharacterized protein YjbI with pentapeptide repeats